MIVLCSTDLVVMFAVAVDSVQEKSGIAGRDDLTVLQKAQAVVQTAAAATAEKASQAYQ